MRRPARPRRYYPCYSILNGAGLPAGGQAGSRDSRLYDRRPPGGEGGRLTMAITLPPSNDRPIAAAGWRGTCACAGRWQRWHYEVRAAVAHRDEGAGASGASPLRRDPDLRGRWSRPLSSLARSCCTSPGDTPDCCPPVRTIARAISGIFAALNTIEPPIVEYSMAMILEREESWYEARLPMLVTRVRARLHELSRRPGEADWLHAPFSAGDLLMVTALRRLERSG